MDEGRPLRAEDFGAAWLAFLEQAVSSQPPVDPPLLGRVWDHLGTPPAGLPVVSETFPLWEHPNIQRAVDAWIAVPGRRAELLGLVGQARRHLSLSDLLAPQSRRHAGDMPAVGSVDYVNHDAGRHGMLTCVQFGLYLLGAPEGAAVLLLRGSDPQTGRDGVSLEVLASSPDRARAVLAELREGMHAHNVYRGQVLTIGGAEGPFRRHGLSVVSFPQLAQPSREEIVLPAGVLERIERQTIGFAAHAAELAARGRHLKRGLLLHGPPGTGKTLTIMYLVGQMAGRTVVVLSGRSLGYVGAAFALAHRLQPCTVVLEDVDLVAEERSQHGPSNAVLFELLNAMDGLGEDTDTLVLLTTNRPDLLEPALAARPGRIDLAVEVPLPDAEGRRALLTRYGEGVGLADADLDHLVVRTDGVSAAFIRELVRKAALFAVESGAGPVTRDHLDAALEEFLGAGGELTARLLGGTAAWAPPAADAGAPG